MKTIIPILILFISLTVNAQKKRSFNNPIIADVSCGQCKFGVKEKGCDLAVRIEELTYFIEGTNIDDHGDAHADDGFCSAVRKAEITGEIIDNKFKVSTFRLLPESKEIKK